MSIASSARIHPTAILSADVDIGENVQVGPFSVLEGNIKIGPNCVIRAGAYLFGNVIMGRNNQVFSGAVLGEVPQHLKYNGEPTRLEIGDNNIIREQVTIHRGTTHSMATRIGSDNFIMANSHIAHDCVVGSRCILANGALLAGHTTLEDNVYLSGNAAVHQFIRIGRLAMLSGCSTTTKDIPPFVVQQEINNVVGINVVGMRRAGLTGEQIGAVREAFRIIFRRGLLLPVAVQSLRSELGSFDVVQEMITFLKGCRKGINYMRGHGAS